VLVLSHLRGYLVYDLPPRPLLWSYHVSEACICLMAWLISACKEFSLKTVKICDVCLFTFLN